VPAATLSCVVLVTDGCTRYQEILGCSSVKLGNTTDLYARYTTSFLCNELIQSSTQACSLSNNERRPLCADSCVCAPHLQLVKLERTDANHPPGPIRH